MQQFKSFFLTILLIFVVCAILSSCASVQKYKYFTDISDTAKLTKLITVDYKEPTVQIGDVLYVVIQSNDLSTNIPANAVSITPGTNLASIPISGGQLQTTGYIVDKYGNITLPVVGDIHVQGLTISKAKDVVTEKASQYYKGTNVILRFLNFKVTVLGEVNKPGSFNAPNEKLNLLDALGYAGDLTIYGRRDNVLIGRRQDDGSIDFARINLNNSQFVKSQYFYLKQNDIIYVEPLQTKVTGSDASQSRNLTIASLAITVLAVILTRIK